MSQNKPRRVRSDEKARMLSSQTLVLCARTVISSRGKHAFLVHYSQTTPQTTVAQTASPGETIC